MIEGNQILSYFVKYRTMIIMMKLRKKQNKELISISLWLSTPKWTIQVLFNLPNTANVVLD